MIGVFDAEWTAQQGCRPPQEGCGLEPVESERCLEFALQARKTIFGRSVSRRGKAKYLGGVGIKTTGIAKRPFKANIQKVRVLVNGRVVRMKVSAKALRLGLVTKPVKRNYKPEQAGRSRPRHGLTNLDKSIKRMRPRGLV